MRAGEHEASERLQLEYWKSKNPDFKSQPEVTQYTHMTIHMPEELMPVTAREIQAVHMQNLSNISQLPTIPHYATSDKNEGVGGMRMAGQLMQFDEFTHVIMFQPPTTAGRYPQPP